MSTQNQIVNTEDINLDEFLPFPGAEDVLITEDQNKPSVFSKGKNVNYDFLNDPKVKTEGEGDEDPKANDDEPEAVKPPVIVPGAIDAIFDELNPGDEGTPQVKPKTDKSGLVDTFSKLIEDGTIIPFDDDKKLEDYTVKDFRELIAENIKAKEQSIREQTPKEFFEALPEELQIAARYVAEGGTNIKDMFRALSQVEEIKSLDTKADSHGIVRQYLRSTNFGDDNEVEAQIKEWEEFGSLEKKAVAFKPKLEKMEKDILDEKLKRQEDYRKIEEKAARDYMDNIYKVLEPGTLNGIKLDKKTQTFLFGELTNSKYQSRTGRPTNLLGHLLEKYQFTEPRLDLVAEALWLLSDPDAYRNQIKTQAKNTATQETVRTLKTEQSNKLANTVANEEENVSVSKKLVRPKNIFQRT